MTGTWAMDVLVVGEAVWLQLEVSMATASMRYLIHVRLILTCGCLLNIIPLIPA